MLVGYAAENMTGGQEKAKVTFDSGYKNLG